MSFKLFAAVATAAAVLGGASLAQAQTTQIDLSPYVNQGFNNGGWFIDGGQFAANLPGSSQGNQGSSTPFTVASVSDPSKGTLNFWYGLDNGSGTNLFDGVPNSITIPIAVSDVRAIYTLADNVFGRFGATEFSVTFHGANGDVTRNYVGGVNTRDYNTPNCATTGCFNPPESDGWYDNGFGVVLERQTFYLPAHFGLTSITFNQVDGVDGAILAGLTVSSATPEPATWAMMIAGFGLAGGVARRRRTLAA